MRDAACPLSTRGGTRLVRLVRGRRGGGAEDLRIRAQKVELWPERAFADQPAPRRPVLRGPRRAAGLARAAAAAAAAAPLPDDLRPRTELNDINFKSLFLNSC